MSRHEELEVTPDPPPDVGEAIAAALRQPDPAADESPWWRAGVEESLADEDDALA